MQFARTYALILSLLLIPAMSCSAASSASRSAKSSAPSVIKQRPTEPPPRTEIEIIYALDRAINIGNVDAALELFAEDANVYLTPPPEGVSYFLHGNGELHGWLTREMANGAVIGSTLVESNPNQMIVIEEHTGRWLNHWEISSAQAHGVYTFRNGKIASYTRTFTPEFIEMLDAAD